MLEIKPKAQYGTATYKLAAIQDQMTSIASMNLTYSAKQGVLAAGMTVAEALEVIRALRPEDIFKTMPCDANWNVWQDVYHASWNHKPLYVKFQQADRYFVISFKDL
jgi:motility quorum-sensing regulator/GCU-specific mRNA interferase toxin